MEAQPVEKGSYFTIELIRQKLQKSRPIIVDGAAEYDLNSPDGNHGASPAWPPCWSPLPRAVSTEDRVGSCASSPRRCSFLRYLSVINTKTDQNIS